MRVSVPLTKAYRLLNHGPATLVTSAADGRRNVMAASWVMNLDFDPPKLCAVIASDSYSAELIAKSRELVVNLPTVSMLDTVVRCGASSGRDTDKLSSLETGPASQVGAPLVEGCVGWLECRLLDDPAARQAYDMFVCEVVAAWADDRVFRDGEWRFEGHPDLRTLHHVGGSVFLASGERLSAAEA